MPTAKLMPEDVVETGGRIRDIREAAGMTQAQLGIAVDMPYNTISRYELGEREMGISVLYRLADGLHTSPDKLAPARFQERKCSDTRIEEIVALYVNLDDVAKELAYQGMKAILVGCSVQSRHA